MVFRTFEIRLMHIFKIVIFFKIKSTVVVANIRSTFSEEKKNLLFGGKEFNYAFKCNDRIILDIVK